MRDPYCVGFWLSSAISVSAIAIYFTGIWLSSDIEKAFAYISAVGTVLAGIAGIVVAGITLYGLRIWKIQLYHSKYLSVIWDTQNALRRVEDALTELRADSYLLSKETTDTELLEFIRKSRFGAALTAFDEKCQVLDRLVVRNHWQWSNYAHIIEDTVRENLKHALRFKFISGDKKQMFRYRLQSASRVSLFKKFVDELNEMLDDLESKYGV